MKLNNESLKGFDALLKQCLEKSQKRAKLKCNSRDQYLQEVANGMRVELDRTRTQLSQQVYNVDMAMNHGADSAQKRNIYEVLQTQNQPKPTSDDELLKKYIRNTSGGYEVYDKRYGYWVSFPQTAEINVRIEKTPNRPPVMLVKAYDAISNKRLEYTDDYILTPHVFSPSDHGYVSSSQNHMEHTDSWFNSVAMGNGAIGTTAGTLEAFLVGSSQYKTPETLFGKTILDGKWKNKAGNWHNFKELDLETNGFKKQSLKVSKHWAKQRSAVNLRMANNLKFAGKVCFGISIFFSARNIRNAKNSDDSNKRDVYIKNGLDITMGVVAFIPVYGWAISGTYFLLDASGAFGNFGQASGFSIAEANAMHAKRQQFAKDKMEEVIFEFDLEPTKQQQFLKIKQQQLRAQDNTYVAPRTLFRADFK